MRLGASLNASGVEGLKSRCPPGRVPALTEQQRAELRELVVKGPDPAIQPTEYAVGLLNAAGGLLGRQIQLINYDTQSSMQLYSQYAQQLVLKDRVDVVQGGITSASREAIRPTLDRL